MTNQCSRVIVYGDIHGCLDELIDLRKKINIKQDDVEICVGDLVFRGPKEVETLEYMSENKIICVRGNNDDIFLRLRKEQLNDTVDVLEKKYLSSKDTLEKVSDKEFEFIENMPFFYKIFNLTIVHAGLLPSTNLSTLTEKESQLLTRISYIDENGEYVKQRDKQNYKHFWTDLYDGREGFVVYGHCVFNEAKKDELSLGIDTGCVYGQKLTAAIFNVKDKKVDTENFKLVSENAYEKYA